MSKVYELDYGHVLIEEVPFTANLKLLKIGGFRIGAASDKTLFLNDGRMIPFEDGDEGLKRLLQKVLWED